MPAETRPPLSEPLVLVGTYRKDQLEDWVLPKGLYNYPIDEEKDTLDSSIFVNVKELWLFNGTKAQRTFGAEFLGVLDRKELEDYPSGKGKPHGSKYLLFKVVEKYGPSLENSPVIVRARDFAARTPQVAAQIREALRSSDAGKRATVAKHLPPVIVRTPPERLCVCEGALQLDFSDIFERAETLHHVAAARVLLEQAHAQGQLTCVEICAGAGGQAIGLERAGFEHIALVEYEREYCDVLAANRPAWNVICGDVHKFDGRPYRGVDLFAGGVPCPPFSVASKQLGEADERDLFPEAIRLIGEIRPRAVMLENVRGFLDPKFDGYRRNILDAIAALGYRVDIKLLNASDYGVPQLRPRIVIVGIRNDEDEQFHYPAPNEQPAPTVGQTLRELIGANGWRGADAWAAGANKIAPTVVGGSKKHGGPDLGPVRARRAWAELGVDGLGVADTAPPPDFQGHPKLTPGMLSLIQGFPAEWNFGRKKTSACRMIGNAFPPPVAQAVGQQIRRVLRHEEE